MASYKSYKPARINEAKCNDDTRKCPEKSYLIQNQILKIHKSFYMHLLLIIQKKKNKNIY